MDLGSEIKTGESSGVKRGSETCNMRGSHSGDDIQLERLFDRAISGVNNRLFVPSQSESQSVNGAPLGEAEIVSLDLFSMRST
jgi:hypothetical protein